jgi:hypothetical protein
VWSFVGEVLQDLGAWRHAILKVAQSSLRRMLFIDFLILTPESRISQLKGRSKIDPFTAFFFRGKIFPTEDITFFYRGIPLIRGEFPPLNSHTGVKETGYCKVSNDLKKFIAAYTPLLNKSVCINTFKLWNPMQQMI